MADLLHIQGGAYDEERAFYGSRGILLSDVAFDGPADGESALKESQNVTGERLFCNLRYPFWHVNGLDLSACELTDKCRAALWYSADIRIRDSKLHGIKALRECDRAEITGGSILSQEFGWFSREVTLRDLSAESEYLLLRAKNVHLDNVQMKGKYSFQYVTDSLVENSTLDTKDAFWHTKNMTVRNCTVKGEYLGWYSENLRLEDCTILGTQPLCYCKNLTLVRCRMVDTDLAFEKSSVEAEVLSRVDSVKNPASGHIRAQSIGELILDAPTEAVIEVVEK